MKGDFTRDTFDPANHFSRVLMQQGRVQLDSDWNEQTAILLHYLRTLARDVLGTAAGPAASLGFGILTGDSADLDAKLDEWEPSDTERRDALRAAAKEGDVIIGPGRYYVHGILVENGRPMLYSEQRGYPFDDRTTLESLDDWQNGMLLYLDVWEQFVTAIEAPSIRDVALNGVDTCGRAKVMWAVRALLQERGQPLDCAAAGRLPSLGNGRLRASAQPDRGPPDPCLVAPDSQYRGTENQLYRVEVHRGGEATATAGTATFKWSRENGSVIFPIKRLTGKKVTLGALGRDQRLGLEVGNWVEVLDDALVGRGEPGHLARVDLIEPEDLTVTLAWPDGVATTPSYTEADAGKHPVLRRWDHAGDLKKYGGALAITEGDPAHITEGWITLEDGIRVRFERGAQVRYRAGDYWLIPARTATGDIDWPRDPDVTTAPVGLARPAHGTRHYYAPLYLKPDAGAPHDCRCRIEKLPCAPP